MSTSRKILIGILVILTILLGGVSAYIMFTLNSDEEPATVSDDVSVSGFGETSTKDLYRPVSDGLSAISCDHFITGYTFGDGDKPTSENKTFLDSEGKTTTGSPVWCDYNYEDGRKISLTIHMYDEDSKIANSQEEMFQIVNTLLISNSLDSGKFDFGEFFNMTYFYGEANSNASICHTTLFHNWNDFGYALVIYDGFECSESVDMNKALVNVISERLNTALVNIYHENGINPGNFEDYVENLNIPL